MVMIHPRPSPTASIDMHAASIAAATSGRCTRVLASASLSALAPASELSLIFQDALQRKDCTEAAAHVPVAGIRDWCEGQVAMRYLQRKWVES